ncbi:MAG: nucleotidyl transferase AbiEii/AbiGii toxin family protein [Candidatus Micrarchaeia archaeon]
MELPLEKRLKKRLHIDIAYLQDELVDILYDLKNEFVFHGGTCIWRCYSGGRFSEDLDFYGNVEKDFKNKLEEKLKTRGLILKKYKKTENVLFSKISKENIEVRLEIRLTGKKGIIGNYEKTDGTIMNVLMISAEELLLEKIDAYSNRRLIRDIYDIFYLSSVIELGKQEKNRVRTFLSNIGRPLDEGNLKAIVYAGNIPNFNQIVEYLKRKI